MKGIIFSEPMARAWMEGRKIVKRLFRPKKEMIKVTRRHREALLAAARKLQYLEVVGVKKWDGYEEAIGWLETDGFDENGYEKMP